MKGFQAQELTSVIEIDRKACKGCDSCKSFCPTNAIDGKYGAVHTIDKEKCIFCGQCLVNCPFGAPTDVVDPVDQVIAKLKDSKTTVVTTIAPAVRVAIGEEFGMEPGTLATEKMYGALQKAGFKIGDTNYTADLTIMEEGSELIAKIRHYMLGEPVEGHHLGAVPQFTSCCPGWVRYVELYYPQLIPNLSSAKSPMMMHGALIKTYGAKELYKTEPENIFVVGVMPCTAKKFEASRKEFHNAAEYWGKQGRPGKYPDVDTVLTTRDLARLLKKLNINLATVSEVTDENPMAMYSGAGTIFGNTGGVMEAALRTAYFVITGKELEIMEFTPVRGLKGVKEASVTMKDAKTGKEITVNVAVVHDVNNNLKPIADAVVAGTSKYHFIEVMNCPAGCINGGGQPINPMGTSWLDKAKAILPWS